MKVKLVRVDFRLEEDIYGGYDVTSIIDGVVSKSSWVDMTREEFDELSSLLRWAKSNLSEKKKFKLENLSQFGWADFDNLYLLGVLDEEEERKFLNDLPLMRSEINKLKEEIEQEERKKQEALEACLRKKQASLAQRKKARLLKQLKALEGESN